MATGEDQGDTLQDLLTCSICLETYKDPRYLPCLHTFCKSCIHTFILSSVETEGGFPCPVCRQVVHVQDITSTEGRDDLADTLPVDQFIVSLLDKQAIRRSDKLCDVCDINESKNTAVSWCVVCEEAMCRECEKYHRLFKMSANHRTVSICELKKNDDFKTSELVNCRDHPTRAIEVYCDDHSKACCTLCATLSHRKCDKVISVEDAATGIRTEWETTKLLQQIDRSAKVLNKVVQNRKQNLADIETESDAISSNISKIKRDIIQHLNNIEDQIQTELVATRKQLSLQVTDDVDRFQSQHSALIKWKTLLQGVLDHGSDQQCLVILNEVKEKVRKLETELKEELPNVHNVNIQCNTQSALNDFCNIVQSFGNIEIEECNSNVDISGIIVSEDVFHSGYIEILHTLNTGTQSSGAFFGEDIILAVKTLSSHNVIKYSDEFNILSNLKLPTEPYDIVVVDDTRVVVSSWQRKVYIINGVHMILQRTVRLTGITIQGVCYYGDNQLIVAHNKTLTWLNMTSGAKIKSETTAGQSYYVSLTGNHGYISGDGNKSVSCVVDGSKKFSYTSHELNYPRGVSVDCHGNIYIAGNASKNIHQITNDGKLVRIIPAATIGVTKPWTIGFKPNSNRFLVTCTTGKVSICIIDE